ncbi:MAG: hypothetical protein AB2761_20560 [Candidatus Thiodiazotropha endolucinida]
MTENANLRGIETELERLGQSRWLDVIIHLVDNYQGYPIEDENQLPSEAIHNILKSLNPDDTPEARFVHRVQNLDCFSYRAYYKDGNGRKIYWNPLEQQYQDFESHAKQTICYQVDNEYPPSDIIRAWMYEQVTKTQ